MMLLKYILFKTKMGMGQVRDGHRGGWWGGTPIVNFEVTPHHKNFKWFTVGGTPIKISYWSDKIIKIAKTFTNIS